MDDEKENDRDQDEDHRDRILAQPAAESSPEGELLRNSAATGRYIRVAGGSA